MRNLIIGIALGATLALAAGTAAHPDTGRYQIAVTMREDAGPYIFRLDTRTGAVETSCPGTLQRDMLQFIQPK